MKRAFVAAVFSGCLAACSLGPAPSPPIAIYDFGLELPARTAVKVQASLALDEISAPATLHSAAILYRLTYRDGAQIQPYSRARWAAAPAVLVQQRLHQALGQSAEQGVSAVADGVRSQYVLRVELESFVQAVDSADAARGIVRLRASLIDSQERRLRAQRTFTAEQPSSSVDAAGAVRALSAATDTVITQLIEWTGRETQSKR